MHILNKNLCRPINSLQVVGSLTSFSSGKSHNDPDAGDGRNLHPVRGAKDFLRSRSGTLQPTHAKRIPADSPLRYEGLGLRIDRRSPEEMRNRYKAFKGRGDNLDIKAHVKGSVYNSQTGLVSFSRTMEGTRHVRNLLKVENYLWNRGAPLYLYAIRLQRHNSYHADRYSQLDEDEVVTEEASLRNVEWVQVRHPFGEPSETIRRPFTPSSDLPANRFGAPLEPHEIPFRQP